MNSIINTVNNMDSTLEGLQLGCFLWIYLDGKNRLHHWKPFICFHLKDTMQLDITLLHQHQNCTRVINKNKKKIARKENFVMSSIMLFYRSRVHMIT